MERLSHDVDHQETQNNVLTTIGHGIRVVQQAPGHTHSASKDIAKTVNLRGLAMLKEIPGDVEVAKLPITPAVERMAWYQANISDDSQRHHTEDPQDPEADPDQKDSHSADRSVRTLHELNDYFPKRLPFFGAP